MILYLDTSALLKLYVAEEGPLTFDSPYLQRRWHALT